MISLFKFIKQYFSIGKEKFNYKNKFLSMQTKSNWFQKLKLKHSTSIGFKALE